MLLFEQKIGSFLLFLLKKFGKFKKNDYLCRRKKVKNCKKV